MSHLMTNGKPCGRPDGHNGKHRGVASIEHTREITRNHTAKQRSQPGTCGRKGCNEPKQQFSSGQFDTFCLEHRREAARNWHKKLRSQPGTCSKKGCNEPKQQFSSGQFATHCVHHMREVVRNSWEKRQADPEIHFRLRLQQQVSRAKATLSRLEGEQE